MRFISQIIESCSPNYRDLESIKLHKQNKPRYMARCHQTTLTQLGEWLTRTLKATLIGSEEVWKDMFMTAGVITTSSWVINSNGQVRKRMDKWITTQGSLTPTHHGTSRLMTSLKCTQLLSWSHQQGMEARTVATWRKSWKNSSQFNTNELSLTLLTWAPPRSSQP